MFCWHWAYTEPHRKPGTRVFRLCLGLGLTWAEPAGQQEAEQHFLLPSLHPVKWGTAQEIQGLSREWRPVAMLPLFPVTLAVSPGLVQWLCAQGGPVRLFSSRGPRVSRGCHLGIPSWWQQISMVMQAVHKCPTSHVGPARCPDTCRPLSLGSLLSQQTLPLGTKGCSRMLLGGEPQGTLVGSWWGQDSGEGTARLLSVSFGLATELV